MTKDEALKLALEALVEVKSWKSPTRWDGCFNKEITAIKEALSSCQCPECRLVLHASDCAVHNEPAYPKGECNCGAQPEQEPVQWGVDWGKAGETPCVSIIKRKPNGGIEVVAVEYGPPPQRKPLTDEEIDSLYETTESVNWGRSFARAIEAAHGIKGEA